MKVVDLGNVGSLKNLFAWAMYYLVAFPTRVGVFEAVGLPVFEVGVLVLGVVAVLAYGLAWVVQVLLFRGNY
jgi:hypothetical protein